MCKLRLCLISLVLIAFQLGCASVVVTHAPAEFDLAGARIDAAGGAPPVVSTGPRGKVVGAAAGGAAGAVGVGIGAGVISALPCLVLGPYAAPCFAAVGPAAAMGAVVGGVTGATVGAATAEKADSAKEATAKSELFATALAGLAVREILVDRLRGNARESAKIELPVFNPKAQDPGARWIIAIETIEIGPSTAGADARYALFASAGLAVREARSGVIVFQKRYQALSPDQRTTSEWGNGNADAARSTLDGLMLALAKQMFSNLSREDLMTTGVLWTESYHRKKESFSRRTSAIITKVDGAEHRGEPPIQLQPGQHLVEVAYRRESYLCGFLGCVDFEEKRTAFELHVEPGHSYMPFAMRHCDKDWIGIVDTGRSAKDELASWQAIGRWQFGDMNRNASTHVASAGELPPVTCQAM